LPIFKINFPETVDIVLRTVAGAQPNGQPEILLHKIQTT